MPTVPLRHNLEDEPQLSTFNTYKDRTLVQMKIHANQQSAEIERLRDALVVEYSRHEKDAKAVNFDRCGCDFCAAARPLISTPL